MEFYGQDNDQLREYRTLFVNFMTTNGLYTQIIRQYGVELKVIRGQSIWVQAPLGLSTVEIKINKLYDIVLNYTGENDQDFINLIVLYNLEVDRQKLENWISEKIEHSILFTKFSQMIFKKFPVETVDVSFLSYTD